VVSIALFIVPENTTPNNTPTGILKSRLLLNTLLSSPRLMLPRTTKLLMVPKSSLKRRPLLQRKLNRSRTKKVTPTWLV